MSSYAGLSRAALSFEYLHTNSTTHEFLFGALAELIDNSKDARSKKIEIYSERNDDLRGGYMLCFLDDGCGMNRDEGHRVITFGRSAKKAMDTNVVGQYGNGLKSGSMRVAKDFIVFSKTKDQLVCIYMSRTFHEDEKIEEVIVPIPCWDVKNRKPFPSTPEDLERHSQELEIIYRHSPFKTETDIFSQFDKIESDTGTLVILMHMKLLDNGEAELDIASDPTDIIMGSEKGLSHEGLVFERRSLRAYTSILYLEPVMKIYIQGIKVQTRRLANCLYKPKQFKFTSNRFKTRAENDAREAREHAKLAEEKAREAESKYRDLLKRVGNSANREARSKLNLAKNDAEDHRSEAIYKTKLADQKEKMLKDPKILHLIFGFNIENRSCDGMFMYNCGRLIKMYDRTGPQQDGKVTCNGIVGIVDVPYIVLQPAHNKQDFADGKEYRHLLKVMGEHLVDYWNDSGIIRTGVTEFWESFGYESAKKWWEPPSDEPRFIKRRQLNIPQAIQCDMCLKWRLLPTSSSSIGKQYPPNWVCQNNPDAQYNRCNAPEQKFSFPLIDRKKLNKDTNGLPTPEDKPPLNTTEMPSFGRTILKKPDVLPPVKIFKPSPMPMPVIAPTKVNETPKLINQTPVPQKRTSAPETSANASKVARRRSPSPPPPPSRAKSQSGRVLNQPAPPQQTKEKLKPVPRRKSPSPPPAKQKVRQARKSPSPEPPKRSRKKSPSPEVVDKRKSAALLNNVAAVSSSRSRRKSPSPVPEAQPKTNVRSSRDREVSKKAPASEADSDTQSESSQSSRKTQDSPIPKKSDAKKSANNTSPPAVKQAEKKTPPESASSEDSTAFEPSIGSEVQVALGGSKWADGSVLEIHPRTKKLKVQFQQKSMADRWVMPNEVRRPVKLESFTPVQSKTREKSPVAATSSTTTASITTTTTQKSNNHKVESEKVVTSKGTDNHSEEKPTKAPPNSQQPESALTNGEVLASRLKIETVLRNALNHFCPPDWNKTHPEINSLDITKLAEFPMTTFFEQYEASLRGLLNKQVTKKVEQEKARMRVVEAEKDKFVANTKVLIQRLFPQQHPGESEGLDSWIAFLDTAAADIPEDNGPSSASSNTVNGGDSSSADSVTAQSSSGFMNGSLSSYEENQSTVASTESETNSISSSRETSAIEVNSNGHDSAFDES